MEKLKKFKQVINDDFETRRKLSRNFFFAGTIIVILLNVLLYVFNFNTSYNPSISNGNTTGGWNATLSFAPIFQAFLNSFSHVSASHIIVNMLGVLIAGLYLERKMGSIRFIFLTAIMAFVTSIAINANFLATNWRGFSGVNFGLFFYIFVDYIFMLFNKQKRNRFNIISGLVDLVLIYALMCIDGTSDTFVMRFYPINLINNMGHYSGALAGLVLGFTVQVSKINVVRLQNPN